MVKKGCEITLMLSKRFKNDGKPTLKINELQKSVKKQVKEKTSEGIYLFENVPCCICGESDFQLLSEKDRYGLFHPVVICRDCGLVQANPRMTQESYKQFYEIEYRKLYGGSDTPTDEFLKEVYQHGSVIYQYLTENLQREIQGCFIVEIGCASGGILQYFREKGNEVYGVDLDSDYLEYGRVNYNLDLEVGTIDNVVGLGRTPDVVIYSHTLEHIPDLISELKKLRLILTRNSFLYIELPGNKYLRRAYQYDFLRLLQNAHIYYFTQTTLTNLLRKVGYEFVCGDEAILSIFRKSVADCSELDKGIYQIANDYTDAMSFLRRRESFRHFFYYASRMMFLLHKMRNLLRKVLISFLKTVGLYSFARRIYHRVRAGNANDLRQDRSDP